MEKNLVPVEGERNLFRDLSTNAILNTCKSDYLTYIKRKEAKLNTSERIQEIENNISSLKNDISEIKNILKVIANGSK